MFHIAMLGTLVFALVGLYSGDGNYYWYAGISFFVGSLCEPGTGGF